MAKRGLGVTVTHCRPFNLTAVRDGFAACLSAVDYDGQPLRVSPWLADAWNPPCALVGTFTVEFSDGQYSHLTSVSAPVRLVVPVAALRPSQQDLDAILAVYVTALDADPTLSGAVQRCMPVRATPTITTRGNQDSTLR